MIFLRDLLAPWFHYSGQETIQNLCLDSRQVNVGDLFIAVPGYAVDGRQYITRAFAQGASAVLVHTDAPAEHGKVVVTDAGVTIYFCQLHRQLSALALQAYPINSDKMAIVGITGTNGKTSVSQLIAQLVQLEQQQAAVMGTLGNGVWGSLIDSGNTTADAITVIKQLAQFAQQGIDVCAMEVSSHGLVQGRVEAVPFSTAVFTNLSRDHLDFHGDMNSYAAAKQRLFNFSCVRQRLLNLDDEQGVIWFEQLQQSTQAVLGYSTKQHPQAQLYVTDIEYHGRGMCASLHWPEGQAVIDSPLLGEFNLANLLAALGALYLEGYELTRLASLVQQLKPVAGRMECFTSANDITLVVDYAHTPDAIEQALKAARVHCQGKLWCLFGCGGDRDTGKRPLMAAAAEQFSDQVMVTSDNCRSEDPQIIIDDILVGLQQPQSALVEIDRIEAIKQVFAQAQQGDVILLAGKGHETYQEVKGEKLHYDERALAQALAEGTL